MSVLILDPYLEQRIRAERQDSEMSQYDEVWEGVLVVAPLPNNDHQRLVTRLSAIFSGLLIDWDHGDQVFSGTNVSDRDVEWTSNYRVPDIAVYLATNPAKNSASNSLGYGGPDLAVEIVSPGDEPA